MSIEKIKIGSEEIYVNSDIVDEKETGVAIYNKNNLEKTMEFEPINYKDILEDTLTDINRSEFNE